MKSTQVWPATRVATLHRLEGFHNLHIAIHTFHERSCTGRSRPTIVRSLSARMNPSNISGGFCSVIGDVRVCWLRRRISSARLRAYTSVFRIRGDVQTIVGPLLAVGGRRWLSWEA